MRRRQFVLLVGAAVATTPRPARGQPGSGRVARIGILHTRDPYTSPGFAAFRVALRELGYVEGDSLVFETRWAAPAIERLPAVAVELVRLRPQVIVTGDPTTTAAALAATKEIPIVMAVSTDPVAAGFVATLARPGGNVTGLSILAPELSGKRLEILREAVPRLSRVAVLWNARAPHHRQLLRETEDAGRTLGVTIIPIDTAGRSIEAAFNASVQAGAGAVLAVQAAEYSATRQDIAALGLKYRLPTMTAEDGFAEAGGLLQYGASTSDLWRRAAGYVDRILRGARPADLPVEQPTKVEFIVNLKTAQALSLTLPPSLRLRADKVIE